MHQTLGRCGATSPVMIGDVMHEMVAHGISLADTAEQIQMDYEWLRS